MSRLSVKSRDSDKASRFQDGIGFPKTNIFSASDTCQHFKTDCAPPSGFECLQREHIEPR